VSAWLPAVAVLALQAWAVFVWWVWKRWLAPELGRWQATNRIKRAMVDRALADLVPEPAEHCCDQCRTVDTTDRGQHLPPRWYVLKVYRGVNRERFLKLKSCPNCFQTRTLPALADLGGPEEEPPTYNDVTRIGIGER